MLVRTVAMLLIGDIRMDGRVQKEIRTLQSRGFGVTLIQCSHCGNNGLAEYEGAEVVDFPRPLRRSALANFLRQIQFNVFALRHLKRLSPDFVQCNDLNTLLAGFLFRRQARVIYDAHELFPEQYQGLRKLVWSWIEKLMVRASYACIQPEKNRLSYFSTKYGIDRDRIALVENFPSRRFALTGRGRLREYFALGPLRILILYTGVLGPGREIEKMISCMALLDARFVLILMGPTFKDYERQLASRIREANVSDRVRMHPSIPNAEMLDYVSSSDIGLVFYQNINLNNYWCASNKLYEFILCGKPVVTNNYPGIKEVITHDRLGVCLADVSPATIASAVRQVEEARSEPVAPSPYVWEQQEATYLSLFGS